jgi:hypothetical protein
MLPDEMEGGGARAGTASHYQNNNLHPHDQVDGVESNGNRRRTASTEEFQAEIEAILAKGNAEANGYDQDLDDDVDDDQDYSEPQVLDDDDTGSPDDDDESSPRLEDAHIGAWVAKTQPVAGARASSEGPPRNEPTVPTRPAPLPYGRGTGRTQFQETQPEGDGPPCGTSLDLPCGNFPSSAEGGRGIPWRRPPRAVPALWRLQPQQRRTDWHDIWDHHTSQATRAGAWCALHGPMTEGPRPQPQAPNDRKLSLVAIR